MNTNKVSLKRAYDEIVENINNLLTARYEDYIVRVNQLFNSIENNNVLNVVISPFLSLNLDEEKIGFKHSHRSVVKFEIPVNEDHEIALILQLLHEMKNDKNSALNIPHRIYMQKGINDNLRLFNNNIIEPALMKLSRKFRYKVEDLTAMTTETIDLNNMTIINIENINANNSAIAVGQDINQSYNSDKFSELKKAIGKIDNLNDREALLLSIKKMESSIDDKNSYKHAYDEFLTRLGTYVTIVTPFLEYLSSFLK